jgi:hypothetical protein
MSFDFHRITLRYISEMEIFRLQVEAVNLSLPLAGYRVKNLYIRFLVLVVYLLGLLFDPEDGSSKSFRNVLKIPQPYMWSHPGI